MIPLKTIFVIFINLNIIGLLALFYYSSQLTDNRNLLEPIALHTSPASAELERIYTVINPFDSLSFVDTKLAAYLLNALDTDQWYPQTNHSNFSKPFIGLKHDPTYCTRWHAYFAQHPEEVFEDYNVLMDFPDSHLMRKKVLPNIGNDLQKWVTVAQPAEKKNNFTFNISAKANGFFFNDMAHNYQQIGKTFACVGQMYNHVPGHGNLNRKDRSAESLVQYSKLYEDRPQCFNSSKFFPETWALYLKDQCTEFFNHLNSEEYQKLKQERVIVYIRKIGIGAHMAKGVQPVDDEEENEIRKTWGNGALCGQVAKNYIIQNFVHNPLLVQGHKFDFRIYMLVASTNPVIAFYHDGFLRVSIHEYDINSKDKSVLLTNTELSKGAFKEAANGTLVNGMNETELRNFQMWNFRRLHEYLMETGKVSDPKWVDNYLRPEFKKAMIHLIRMSQSPFVKLSSVYELFGVDFMLDDDLNLWFLECNSSPVMAGTSEEKERFMTTMLQNHYEIIIGLLRSRSKRMIEFINDVTKELMANRNAQGKYELRGFTEKKEAWNVIIQNKFEPEYQPSLGNTWHKIVDENFDGTARYSNFIPEECL